MEKLKEETKAKIFDQTKKSRKTFKKIFSKRFWSFNFVKVLLN